MLAVDVLAAGTLAAGKLVVGKLAAGKLVVGKLAGFVHAAVVLSIAAECLPSCYLPLVADYVDAALGLVLG